MSGVGVEHDQSGDSTRVFRGVDPREKSSNRVANEEKLALGCELLNDGVEVFGNFDKVVGEWSDVCWIRVLREAIELGKSVISKESESGGILTSALSPSISRHEVRQRTSYEDRHSSMTGCQVT